MKVSELQISDIWSDHFTNCTTANDDIVSTYIYLSKLINFGFYSGEVRNHFLTILPFFVQPFLFKEHITYIKWIPPIHKK